ncbi:patatin-like phospholipase family protein [Mediterraneibacter agrestimuris]|uniref:patatin-like phospholipase family protein n=1 Tax=Mediterraneibacter agrestimuris TaxID=2941333 RepID=UPI002F425A0B
MIERATMVLEGGATRGIFTSGVLDYLMEQDFYTSHVIGVSAGSCNAVDYVSRQPGRTRDCMIPTDKSGQYIYGVGKFVKEKSLMNMDLIFDIYPNEKLPFDYDTYFQSEIMCEIVTTNCETGKAEYLSEKSDRERLMKICRASCSLPLITPIVNVDNVPYVDGGLADSVPVERAMKKGNDKVIVILTRNEGYRKKPISQGMARVYKRAYRSYPNLVRAIRTRSYWYNREMDLIDRLEQEGKIFVLRPQVKPVSRIERDTDTLMGFYTHGYELMEKEYERLQEYMRQ